MPKKPEYVVQVRFHLPYSYLTRDDTREIREFITDALESWGGQRHPEDWLFHSLQDVKVEPIKPQLPVKRRRTAQPKDKDHE